MCAPPVRAPLWQEHEAYTSCYCGWTGNSLLYHLREHPQCRLLTRPVQREELHAAAPLDRGLLNAVVPAARAAEERRRGAERDAYVESEPGHVVLGMYAI